MAAENSALHHRNKYILKYIQIEKDYLFNCNNIKQYYFYCILISAALVSIRHFF